MSLTVIATGPLSTLQDLGRPGHGAIGVGEGGAVDRRSANRANRLLGNGPKAAVVESLLGGLSVQADARHVVAVTGAPAQVKIDGKPAAIGAPMLLEPGQTLTIGTPVRGMRTYLAVQGGIEAPTVLGSVGTSTGIGPGPLKKDQVLIAGEQRDAVQPSAIPGSTEQWGPPIVRVIRGPRDDWFTDAAMRALTATKWQVTPDLDRVGIRLDGPELERARTGELPSEGMVRGAIQVPPSGRPIVFLADAPTTGGYPVIACVVNDDLDALAQVRPGDHVRFVFTSARWS